MGSRAATVSAHQPAEHFTICQQKLVSEVITDKLPSIVTRNFATYTTSKRKEPKFEALSELNQNPGIYSVDSAVYMSMTLVLRTRE